MPVYNEAETIGGVLDAIGRVFNGSILIVDDGSTDETVQIVARASRARVHRHETRLGYGKSLIDGFERALALGCDRVVTIDADGQHDPQEIQRLLGTLADGGERVDVASGTRYAPESRVVGATPSERRAINEEITALVNAQTSLGITDAFCGFKAYRVDALKRLRLSEPGWAIAVELWSEMHRCALSVRETPVARIYCDAKRSFGGDLDDPLKRRAHYLEVWARARARGQSRPPDREGDHAKERACE